jgi:hypothetical protein
VGTAFRFTFLLIAAYVALAAVLAWSIPKKRLS